MFEPDQQTYRPAGRGLYTEFDGRDFRSHSLKWTPAYQLGFHRYTPLGWKYDSENALRYAPNPKQYLFVADSIAGIAEGRDKHGRYYIMLEVRRHDVVDGDEWHLYEELVVPKSVVTDKKKLLTMLRHKEVFVPIGVAERLVAKFCSELRDMPYVSFVTP